MTFWSLTNHDFRTDQTYYQVHDIDTELDLYQIMSDFHGAFVTDVVCQQGTLTLPDIWFGLPFLDLLVFQLLTPDFSRTCCVFTRIFILNTPRYFLEFAYDI